MKVICVSREGVRNHLIPKIEVLDELTVLQEVDHNGTHSYIFAEIGPVKINGELWQPAYMSKNFAVLPDTSADEINEAEREGIVNLETSVA